MCNKNRTSAHGMKGPTEVEEVEGTKTDPLGGRRFKGLEDRKKEDLRGCKKRTGMQ